MVRLLRFALAAAVLVLLGCEQRANVVGPMLDLDPWQLTIPAAPLGAERSTTVTIINRGDSPLQFLESAPNDKPRARPPEILGGVAAEFGVVWPAEGLVDGTVLPGDTATLTVRIRPATNPGPREGELRIYTNDPLHSLVTVPVKALVIGCDFEAEAVVDFGHVEPGVPQTMTVTFRNVSNQGMSCDFRNFHFGSGNEPAVFSFREPPPLGIVLANGHEFSLRIGATVPDETEHRSSLQFSFAIDAVELPREIPLLAQGDNCSVRSPPAVDFGPVPTGCSAPEQGVVIKRHCDSGLRITGAWLKRGDTTFLLGEPFQVGSSAAAAWKLPVGYRPTKEGPNRDLLYIAGADGSMFIAPLEGEGIAPTHRERFEEPSAVDVLFVIDGAESMAGLQDRVSAIYRDVKQALTEHMIDWKIGRLWGASPPGEGRTDGWITEVETANSVGGAMRIDSQGTAFVESARKALIDPALNGHNAGFIREQAALAIVVITNHRDTSPKSLDDYVSFFLTRKEPSHRNDIWFAAAAPVEKSPPPPGSGCVYAEGADAALITGVGSRLMGSIEDICAPTSRIASLVAGPRRVFVLSDKPDERERDSIRVQVNGAEVIGRSPGGVTNWTYDPARNAVVFDPAVPLPLRTAITVSYEHVCSN